MRARLRLANFDVGREVERQQFRNESRHDTTLSRLCLRAHGPQSLNRKLGGLPDTENFGLVKPVSSQMRSFPNQRTTWGYWLQQTAQRARGDLLTLIEGNC